MVSGDVCPVIIARHPTMLNASLAYHHPCRPYHLWYYHTWNKESLMS